MNLLLAHPPTPHAVLVLARFSIIPISTIVGWCFFRAVWIAIEKYQKKKTKRLDNDLNCLL